MDQPAQNNSQDLDNFDSLTDDATQEKIGPIQAGQFVVSGDDDIPNKQPTDNTQSRPQSPPLTPPVLKTSSNKNPDELLSQIAQSTGGHTSTTPGQQGQPVSSSQPQPKPLTQEQQLPPLQQPPQPVTGLAQDTSLQEIITQPTSTSPSTDNQPDPTPYTQPHAAPPPTQGSSGGMLKILIIAFGILILIAIASGLFWYFVLQPKNQEPTQSDVVDDIILEDPTLPPRRGPGFGSLPQATTSATPSAQPQLPSGIPLPLLVP